MADFGKLTDQQRQIAIKIADEARAQGVDPELALAVGWAENRFNPSGRSPKGAVGPMQVMPSNARGLGIDPKDLLDPDKNIRAGVTILKENLDRFGNPSAALVGYNFDQRAARKFAETGDMNLLPDETRMYLEKIGQLTNLKTASPYGELAPVPPERTVEGVSELPEAYQMTRRALFGEGEIKPAATALIGAVAGTATGGAERLYDIFGSRGTNLPEKLDTGPRARLPSDSADPGAWGRKTGHGLGTGSTRAQSQRYKRAMPKGKVSGRTAELFGEGADTFLDIERQAAAAAEREGAEKLERELAERTERSKSLQKLSKGLGRIPGGSILAGGMAGKDLAEAMQRYEEGDVSGALINLVGGLGSAAALVPHPVPRLVGGALGLATIPAEYINDVLKGKIKPPPRESDEYMAP